MRLRENHNYIPTTKNYTTACEFKTPFLLWGTQQRYSNALLCCVASHLVADENLWLCHFPDTLHGLCYSEKKKHLTLEDFCLGRALLVRRYQSGNIC